MPSLGLDLTGTDSTQEFGIIFYMILERLQNDSGGRD